MEKFYTTQESQNPTVNGIEQILPHTQHENMQALVFRLSGQKFVQICSRLICEYIQ